MLRWLCTCIALLAFYMSPLLGNENNEVLQSSQESIVEPIKLSLLSEERTVQHGMPFWVLVNFDVGSGWHTYWSEFITGKDLKVEWRLPDEYTVSRLIWPAPKKVMLNGEWESVYDKEFSLLAEITPSPSIFENKATIEVAANWIVCSDSTCMPGSSESKLNLVVSKEPTVKNPHTALFFEKARHQEPFTPSKLNTISLNDEAPQHTPLKNVKAAELSPNNHSFEGGIGIALLFAFIGGLILNLMPCVLPVISFKIFSFMKMAGQNRALTCQHGLAFSFGVLLSFWILAGALMLLQAYGHVVGWGFQLQEPLFVGILAAILVIMSLNFFGVFEPGSFFGTLASSVSKEPKSQSKALFSSFVSGILATAVATPCTGPFLGSAVGYAVTQPPAIALLVFTFLGLGMALPYLLLSAFPQLLSFLPKPGNWMITFKEFMGFVLLATVLWLVWVFAAQTNALALMMLLIGFFFIALGCWIYGKWGTPVKAAFTRALSVGLSLACIVSALSLIVYAARTETDRTEIGIHEGAWEKFSPEKVAMLQAQGIPVFVDFTAKWCLICQANHMILSADHVAKKFAEHGVVRMKADWTSNDPVITQELRKFGRSGVPLYVLYDKDTSHSPVILPQVLTPDVVITHLNALNPSE